MAYPYPAQPSASAPMPPLPTAAVFGPQYCAPYPVDLAIVKKVMTISDGNFAVTDVNGNIMFKVKGSLLTLRDRRVLLDGAGNPITTLRRKVRLTLFDLVRIFFHLTVMLSPIFYHFYFLNQPAKILKLLYRR